MDIHRHFEKLQVLKDELATSVTAKAFVASHKKELMSLLRDGFPGITIPTKDALKDLLDENLSRISRNIQSAQRFA
jgi:hypothetical protein